MKDSIVIDMRFANYDLIDGSPVVERHHIMGAANRDKASEDGLWIPLTPAHHNSSKMSVHHNREMRVMSHIIGQLAYELEMISTGRAKDKAEAKEMFRKRYGRTFI